MHSRYPGSDDLAGIYASKSNDWLRAQLASGSLTWEAASAAVEELARRGEAPPASPDQGRDRGEAAWDEAGDQDMKEDLPWAKRAWPWWPWLVVFVLVLIFFMAQGITAHGPENQGFLWGVIALQSVVATLATVMLASFAKTKSAAGVFGRLIVLGLLAVALFGLWVLSSLARNGWGG